jgi:hypothetical protein
MKRCYPINLAQRHIIPIDLVGIVDRDDYPAGFPKIDVLTVCPENPIDLCSRVITLPSNSLRYGRVSFKLVDKLLESSPPFKHGFFHLLLFVGDIFR